MTTQAHKTREEVGDRTDWILRLLYAPAGGEPGKPIVGITRLMKGCFLLHRTLENEFGIQTDFSFRADDYGPLDPLVYDSVEILEEDGLIERTESQKYDGEEFSLTDAGMDRAYTLTEDQPEEVRKHLTWLKSKHVLKSLPKLLSFVYNQYPDMADNSKIA